MIGEVVLYESTLHALRVTNRRVLHERRDKSGTLFQSVALHQVGMCEFRKTTRPLYLVVAAVLGIVASYLGLSPAPSSVSQLEIYAVVCGVLLIVLAALACVGRYFVTRTTALLIRAGGGVITVPIKFRDARMEFAFIVRAIHGAQVGTLDGPGLAAETVVAA
jgi:hypothetical protein